MNAVNCFVGLFDILGFKALRVNKGTAGLYQLFERAILTGVQHSAAGRGKTEIREGTSYWVPDFNEQSVGFRIFSDTVLIYTKDDSLLSFFSIVSSGSQLLVQGFCGTKAPFRGAIGYGDFIDDGTIIIGSALEDAYSWESRQAWAGAMFTPTCLNFVNQKNYLNTYRTLLEEAARTSKCKTDESKLRIAVMKLVTYMVPIKTGQGAYDKMSSLVIDWTLNTYDGAGKDAFVGSENPHALTMQRNTMLFEKLARERSRE